LGIRSTGAEEGYYSMSFGLNVVKNIALGVSALLNPVSTVRVALEGPIWKAFAGIWILTGVLCVALSVRSTRRFVDMRSALWLISVAAIAQGPVAFMPHLTEANFTRSLAPGIIAIAICLRPLWNEAKNTVLRPGVMIGLIVLWLAIDLVAVHEKSSGIVAQQERSGIFRQNAVNVLRGAGPEIVHFAVIDPGWLGYSAYRQPVLVDIHDGDVPYALKELLAPQVVNADYFVVSNIEQARSMGADFVVYDNGDLVALKSGKP
jgi:hypothetical protein